MAKGKNKGGNAKKDNKKGGKGRGGKGGGGDEGEEDEDDDEAAAPIVVPQPTDFKAKMDKRVERLVSDFDKIRGGAIRPDMFNHLQVAIKDMGSVALTDVSQITMLNPLSFEFSVYDPELVKEVGAGLRDAGMGINPTKGERDNVWAVKVTKPSKESRELLVKQCSVLAEKGKQDIRNVRKDGLDKFKKLKGKISDDDLKRHTKEVEGFSDKAVEQIVRNMKAKEAALLN